MSRALLDMDNLTPSDWYKLVPKSLLPNAQYRQFLLAEAGRSRDLQRVLRQACQHSLLFWINTFCWGLDPRETDHGTISPFVTFQCQDNALTILEQSLYPQPGSRQSDVLIEKSRDMGATWMCVLLFLWSWLFNPDRHELFCLSWKAELVDGGDKSIFGKIDFTLETQPSWLLPAGWNPRKHRRSMSIENPETGSTLGGEGTSASAGTGGRFRGMFFDEFALVADADEIDVKSADCSDCRIFNSTHKGTHTKFFRMRRNSQIRKIWLHWSDHPWKAEGLYMGTDGKPRSPWYDRRCERFGWNKQAIAEELDIDPVGAGWIFFDGGEIDRLVRTYARAPDGTYDVVHGQLVPIPGGRLRLWCKLDRYDLPPLGNYGIGVDVATGSQGNMSSPSCVSVVNLDTGVKVGEMHDYTLQEEELADFTFEVAKIFHQAKVNWENRGPGAAFRKRLMQVRRYSQVYLAPQGNARKLFGKISDEPGFSPTKDSKRYLLTVYRAALSTGRFLNYSEAALNECLQFIWDGDTVVHSREKIRNDPLNKGYNHGDQVIADALANLFMDDKLRAELDGSVSQQNAGPDPANPPYGSMAWRDLQEERERDEAEMDGW